MILLDFFRQYIPVMYYMGKDLFDTLNSDCHVNYKNIRYEHFMDMAYAMIQKYVSINYNDDETIFSLYSKGLDMLAEQLNKVKDRYYIFQGLEEAEVI